MVEDRNKYSVIGGWCNRQIEKRERNRFYYIQSIKGIMREYTQKNLYNLDEDLLLNKQKMKEFESRRMVYTAIWKAGPLAIIPATSLILSFFNIIPSNNGEAIFLSVCLLIVILGLSAFSWRRSIRIDREIGLIETRLEEIQKNISERVAAVRADLLAYIREMERDSDWELGIDNIKFNDSLQNRIPYDIGSIFGSGRLSDMNQRYPSLMSQIEVIGLEERHYLDRIVEFYNKAVSAILDADRERGVDQSAQQPDRLQSNVKGCFFLYSRGILKKEDLQDVKKTMRLNSPELHFIQIIIEEKATNPYAKLLDNKELESIASEVQSQYNYCASIYIQVKESIKYVLMMGH